MAEIEKLRAKAAQIEKRIRELQARTKSAERKHRTARLIRWGVCVEHMLKVGKIERAEWVAVCREVLSGRDFNIATAEIHSSSTDEAHFCVSPTEKHCAPAASQDQSAAQ